MLMNTHFTGLVDVLERNRPDDELDFLPDRSAASVRGAFRKAFRKYVPYYAKEYVLFPALAGPMWWKVALGNYASEVMRDIYSAATIFCGHVGDDVASYPKGTRAHGRDQWYRMQIASANNFKVPYVVSVFCGALDLQIEHHLFPKFPTNRLRQIAPEVEALCHEYGIEYKTDTWPRTLRKAFRHIEHLSHQSTTPVAKLRTVFEAMA